MFKLVVYTDKYRVWFRHDGEEPIQRLPDRPSCDVMTAQDLVRGRGDNSITHLCIRRMETLPEWLPEVAPNLTPLRLHYIDGESLRDGKFNWQR